VTLRRHHACQILLGLALGVACTGQADRTSEVQELRFWALGREGEVVKSMMPDFEREHPGIRVRVQQLPWSAAHEKLLTAHVGDVTPDIAQIGNTWVPEFVALRALEPLSGRAAASPSVTEREFFPGIWATNVVADTLWGIPWYVDTRLMYYRSDLLRAAGVTTVPSTWEAWRQAMEAVRARQSKTASGDETYGAFLPTNEWNVPVILGLQAGSGLLRDGDTRGAFREAEFRRAFTFFTDLYRDGLAPKFGSNDVANLYQEFARGRFVFYVSGPWQIGEFSRRLPPEMKGAWATAPMPGPSDSTPGVSLAGGSSLVVFRSSTNKDAAWALIEYLSRPEQQARFYELTGDLPSRPAAWQTAKLAEAPRTRAFYEQLFHVRPTPKIPEWELIATRVFERVESVVRGGQSVDAALTALDADVDRILEKRRWLVEREAARP
jgi:multiple sugar transport system substrate-binding protein